MPRKPRNRLDHSVYADKVDVRLTEVAISEARTLQDGLSLVMSNDELPSLERVLNWTFNQRRRAWEWLAREVADANDHKVKRLTKPSFLKVK